MPPTNGLIIRHLGENPGVLRLSRRRRGLPPDTSPTPVKLVSLDNNSSKKCTTLKNNDCDVPLESDCLISEIPQKVADCDQDAREEYVSHTEKITGSHDEELRQDRCSYVGEMRFEKGSCISKDLEDKINVVKLSLSRGTAVESSQERVNFTNVSTHYDLSPVSEVICRHVKEKSLQRNQSVLSTIPKSITRTADSRIFAGAITASTTVTKAAINSVTSTHIHTNTLASYSDRHTVKDTNKGTVKDITKYLSPASSYSVHNSKVTAKASSKGFTEDLTKDSGPVSSYSRTSKGSTKGLTQIKSTTSAVKTRTSPRILLKR